MALGVLVEMALSNWRVCVSVEMGASWVLAWGRGEENHRPSVDMYVCQPHCFVGLLIVDIYVNTG